MKDDKSLEKKYDKKLKLRIVLSAVIICFGILSIIISVYGESKGFFSGDSTMTGYYVGLGGGLIGAGLVTLIKSVILLRNEAKRRKTCLEEYDERNIYLRNCTMTYSGYIMIAVLYAGVFIAGFYNEEIAMLLLVIMCSYLVVIFGVNVLLRKLY